jgi:hypothetical protein
VSASESNEVSSQPEQNFSGEEVKSESDQSLLDFSVHAQVKSFVSKTPTLIIDLTAFLCASNTQLDSLPSDRHADCSINGKRYHSRPYFEDFLSELCKTSDFLFAFAMRLPYAAVLGFL